VKQSTVLQFHRLQTVIVFPFPRSLWKQTSALCLGKVEGEIGLPRFEVKIEVLLKRHHILESREVVHSCTLRWLQLLLFSKGFW